jgi:NAD(P)-dependent dehydrogenase (short-subunit alcohol dehydrogenase family)
MSRFLDGRNLVVTGAASGIGQAVARLAGERGATVTSLDINQPTAEVKRHITCDLSDPASIDEALGKLDDPIHALCNVAGLPGTRADDLVFAVNFLGLRHITEGLMPRMPAGGSIVNVASTAGFGWPQRLSTILDLIETPGYEEGREWFARNQPSDVPAYFFSKEAVTVYTMHSALRAAAGRLRINAVSPGPVETPILEDFEKSMGKETLAGVRSLLGRHARSEDIAPIVLFLASEAAGWVNGDNLVADGGLIGAVASGAAALPSPVS